MPIRVYCYKCNEEMEVLHDTGVCRSCGVEVDWDECKVICFYCE